MSMVPAFLTKKTITVLIAVALLEVHCSVDILLYQ